MVLIDRCNTVTDGLRCFNHLYLDVTREVWAKLQKRTFFGDYDFMFRLDVEFANRYFDALRKWHDGPKEEVPRVWRKLLEKRDDPEVTAIQFAAAGVNAHINLDLAVALVETWKKVPATLGQDVQHDDYNKINDIFDTLYKKFQADFLKDWPDSGPLAVMLSVINEFAVEAARASAWSRGLDLQVIQAEPDSDGERQHARSGGQHRGVPRGSPAGRLPPRGSSRPRAGPDPARKFRPTPDRYPLSAGLPFLTAARLASRAAMRSTTLGASSAASSTTISWPAAFCSMSWRTRSR